MLGWRKKPEGFEWHKYIRTTIKLRRDARRQRVQEARRAAGQQVHAAGAALAAGSRAAGAAARDGTRAGLGALGLFLQGALAVIGYGLRALARPIVAALARPNVGGPVALAGALVFGAGIGRSRGVGMDREAVATLVVGAVLLCALLPMLGQMTTWRLPRLSARVGMAAAGLAVLVGGATWFASGGRVGNLASSVGSLPLIGSAKPLQGRAYAVGPDSLRIGSTTVRLTGIEVPESEQRCGKTGRSWRCGEAATAALYRLVNGRTTSCTLGGDDGTGRVLGQCAVGQRDIGAELVRQGHVFADGAILARYAGQEREARAAKLGLWSGDIDRPAAFRDKVWAEAKRRAPDGCPIKGQVAGAQRFYVLPWSPDYERVRVQKARGERWFCSEQEALAAGFKAAQRG
jgi:endonuclease YncB( thermonuclease family)